MLGTLLSRVCSKNISQKVRFKSVWNWGTQPRRRPRCPIRRHGLGFSSRTAINAACKVARSCSALGGALSAAAVAIGLALLFNDQERSIKFPPDFRSQRRAEGATESTWTHRG
jgi:hypothetical protein